jgi:type II secretory pathway pseudopilin PulG
MMSEFPSQRNRSKAGFTLFEVLIALAVFMLAVTGIAIAIDTALQATLDIRQRSLSRSLLESRLAYCLADPPAGQKRIIEASKNHGVRIEEIMEPYTAKNAQGIAVNGLKKLTITAKTGTQTDSASVLLYRP